MQMKSASSGKHEDLLTSHPGLGIGAKQLAGVTCPFASSAERGRERPFLLRRASLGRVSLVLRGHHSSSYAAPLDRSRHPSGDLSPRGPVCPHAASHPDRPSPSRPLGTPRGQSLPLTALELQALSFRNKRKSPNWGLRGPGLPLQQGVSMTSGPGDFGGSRRKSSGHFPGGSRRPRDLS